MVDRERSGQDLPDPGSVTTLDELVEQLRLLKVWAGDPSYEAVTERINSSADIPEPARRSTVADCFKVGRRRLNTELALAVVAALHPDSAYVGRWRQALWVISGTAEASAQVRVQGLLPTDLTDFSGRADEVAELRQLLVDASAIGDAVVVSGMAGVGKSALAVHVGQLLTAEQAFDRVLFVNLRGFDPSQPPANPAAVLVGFLRLLGVAGKAVPHTLADRVALYRERLADSRTLVLLDDAASESQADPLLPRTPGCLTLITSRRNLGGLAGTHRIAIDVFSSDESATFLANAVPGRTVGADPKAAARIAARCGQLPLALGLLAGHIRATPDWTLTDHADRLDERHASRRLDSDVQVAFDLSYQHLAVGLRRLLRLAARHPGQDFDAYAAAALTDSDLLTTGKQLDQLYEDRLLQQRSPGRYTFHDLVRAHAAVRATEEERPPDRHAALTRLFDYYLGTASAAAHIMFPGEPLALVPPAVTTPSPILAEPKSGLNWFQVEHPTLLAVVTHCAGQGWPSHAVMFSTALNKYLAGADSTDAVTIHEQAVRAARATGDKLAELIALVRLGGRRVILAQFALARPDLQQALVLAREVGNTDFEARAVGILGNIEKHLCNFEAATELYEQSRLLAHENDEPHAEGGSLQNLGVVACMLGRYEEAANYAQHSLVCFERINSRLGLAHGLTDLGEAELHLDRYEPATRHLLQALKIWRERGDRAGEGYVIDHLGTFYLRIGRAHLAVESFRESLGILREAGERNGEIRVLTNLGDATHAAGDSAAAITHYTTGYELAVRLDAPNYQAQAQAGLADAFHALGDVVRAREHLAVAIALYRKLGMPQANVLEERNQVGLAPHGRVRTRHDPGDRHTC